MISRRLRRNGARAFLAAALASVSGLAWTTPAHAQAGDRVAPAAHAALDYDIPAQPLSSALVRFAQTSRLQVLFAQESVDGLTSRPLHGRFTPEDALRALLPDGAPRIEVSGDRIVETPAPPTRTEGAVTTGDEIVVTGTRIRNAAPVGANLTTLDRDAIDATGHATIEGVLHTLPQNFPGSQNELTQLGALDGKLNIAFGSTVDLRGIGADATLTLVNGRRLAPAGFGNFVDVSAIPLAAVERVEVLADGASATYGSDAVGGVVNIILRDSFEGAETSLRYGTVTEGRSEEFGAAQVFGTAWTGGHIVAGYEYRDRGALAARDRARAADSDLRRFGGSNYSSRNASPGNITRIGATPVTLAIPAGQDGTALRQSDLIVGGVNFQNRYAGTDLLPDQTSHGLFVSAHQDIADGISVFLDAVASRRDASATATQVGASIVVPETNAWRARNALFVGQGPLTLSYNFGGDIGPLRYDTRADTLSLATGLTLDLAGGWQIQPALAWGDHTDQVFFHNAFDTAGPFTAALASSDIATAFNPFGDGGANSAAVLRPLLFSQTTENASEITAFSVKADGPLGEIFGDVWRMAIGAEWRKETFSITRFDRRATGAIVPGSVPAPGARTTDALFAELYAPLVSPGDHVPLVEALTLSLSARREQSDDYGAATTPKAGLSWRLTPSLLVRATWGKSFKAPQFVQTLGAIGGTLTTLSPANDPFATNGATGALLLSGSNKALEPERAESWTAGVEFRAGDKGPQFKATYFDIDFANRIGAPGTISTAIRNAPSFAGYLIRNPSADQIAAYLAIPDRVTGTTPAEGVELIWDERLTNLASLRVRGLDLSADWTIDTRYGALSLFASASALLDYRTQPNRLASGVNLLDTVSNPVDWRGRFGAAWRTPRWDAGLTVTYLDDYLDTFSTPTRAIEAWTTADLRLSRRFGRDDDAAGDSASARGETRLTLSVRNLFDAEPPFANNVPGIGYDPLNADPIGRVMSLDLRRRW